MDGAAAALDVSQDQVLVGYFEDENFQWHHRLLLCSLGGARWAAPSPDHSVEIINLDDHRVLPLRRRGPFPARVAGNVYAFDPIT